MFIIICLHSKFVREFRADFAQYGYVPDYYVASNETIYVSRDAAQKQVDELVEYYKGNREYQIKELA